MDKIMKRNFHLIVVCIIILVIILSSSNNAAVDVRQAKDTHKSETIINAENIINAQEIFNSESTISAPPPIIDVDAPLAQETIVDVKPPNQQEPVDKNQLEEDKLQQQLANLPENKHFENIRSLFKIFDNGNINLNKTQLDNSIQYKSTDIPGSNTKQKLLSRAKISPKFQSYLTKKHKEIMESIAAVTELPFEKDSHGIVIVGGGKFTWLSHLLVLQLRKVTDLPVEVLMPTVEDYEKDVEFCENLKNNLNGECVVLPYVLGPLFKNWKDKIGGYQYKSLLILVSKFEHILLLDADNFLVRDPMEIFNHEMYQGMVSWPDYWGRSTTPKFYEIVGKEIGERTRYNRFPLFNFGKLKPHHDLSNDEDITNLLDDSQDDNNKVENIDDDDIPFHDLDGTVPDLSTESGQLIISKSSHICTVLLSTYYNLWGPGIYYRLFSLGDLGEGDKDTFTTANFVCNEPNYAVASFISTIGYFDEKDFHGVAMAQKDPIVDYYAVNDLVKKPILEQKLPINEQKILIDDVKGKYFDKPSTALFAVHANFPKFDPVELMDRDIYDKDLGRLKYKMFNGFEYNDHKLRDVRINFELSVWESILDVVNQNLTFSRSLGHVESIRNFTENQVNWLRS